MAAMLFACMCSVSVIVIVVFSQIPDAFRSGLASHGDDLQLSTSYAQCADNGSGRKTTAM